MKRAHTNTHTHTELVSYRDRLLESVITSRKGRGFLSAGPITHHKAARQGLPV